MMIPREWECVMFWKLRHVAYATVVLCSMAGAASSPGGLNRATDAMAELLAASFLAEHCRLYIQRLGGRSHRMLIEDGVAIQINERDVKMADFVRLTELYTAQAMITFRNQRLRQLGVEPGDRQGMCFLARSLTGSSHGPGRFLERR